MAEQEIKPAKIMITEMALKELRKTMTDEQIDEYLKKFEREQRRAPAN